MICLFSLFYFSTIVFAFVLLFFSLFFLGVSWMIWSFLMTTISYVFVVVFMKQNWCCSIFFFCFSSLFSFYFGAISKMNKLEYCNLDLFGSQYWHIFPWEKLMRKNHFCCWSKRIQMDLSEKREIKWMQSSYPFLMLIALLNW